jgi:hypothetical protein
MAHFAATTEHRARDFAQTWFAARAVLQGKSPYPLIGPGRAFDWPAPWLYPLPAAVATVPLAPFSEPVAVTLFAALSAALFAWALSEHGFGGLLAFASSCVLQAIWVAQWGPLLASAFVILPIGAILVAKPTLGAAVLAARPSWWAVGGGTVLIALSFMSQPLWLSQWRGALQATSLLTTGGFQYRPIIALPWGALVLTALARWRRPEARLLAALACAPLTTLPYEATLVFLVPRGWSEMLTLTVASWLMGKWAAVVFGPVTSLAGSVQAFGAAITAFLYLPATLMILRRPNVGRLPAWLERRTVNWPNWLRGGRE